MSTIELLWSAGMLGALLLVLQGFRRVRRRTRDYARSMTFKTRLPGWVAQFESLLLAATTTATAIGAFWLLFRVVIPAGHLRLEASGAAAVFSVMGVMLVVIPIGCLGANVVSWLVPPARKANLEAMSGLELSFWTANRGLLQFGAASVPIGCGLLALAFVAPWR